MCTQYDENLKQNKFLKHILSNHLDIVKKSFEEHWIICVPRSGTFEEDEIETSLVFDHILVQEKNCSRNREVTYSTLNKKSLHVRNKQIFTSGYQLFSNSVQILFEETFYEQNGLKYLVWCIDSPLFAKTISNKTVKLCNIHDCIDFLWAESLSYEVLESICNACKEFTRIHQFQQEHIQCQKALIGGLYSHCLRISLQNNLLHRKALTNSVFMNNLKLVVETYMQHNLKNSLMFGICTYVNIKDSFLNSVIRSAGDVCATDLNISSEKNCILFHAKSEISKINGYNTILDKIGCLKRTLDVLCENKHENSECLTSDDFLQYFVFLILKTKINNWTSNLIFMKEFKFSSDSDLYDSYLLATLEAALEYVKSNHFRDLKKNTLNISKKFDIFDYVRLGDLTFVKNSLEIKVKEDNTLSYACHPLCSCDNCQNLFITNDIVKQNITICNEFDQSLLIVATIYEKTEIIEYLLTKNCDINLVDSKGRSALHYAALNGSQDILLIFTSLPNINLNTQDNKGNTALHLGVSYGQENCVKALIYSSPDVDLNVVNNSGDTALHLASFWGYISIVHLLLENFAVSSITNKYQKTPSDLAHNWYVLNVIETHSENFEIVNLPVEQKIIEKTEHLDLNSNEVKPKTLEHLKKIDLLLKAIENNDVPLACFYLGFNYDNDCQKFDTSFKCHPLCLCEQCQGKEISETNLEPIKFGVSANCQNGGGFTPLHLAAQFGRKELLGIILDCQADINAKTKKNHYTPLHLACLYQRIQIVKELIKYGNCDINAQDIKGNTSLVYACLKNDPRIVDILVSNDADCNVKNFEGKTVFDICQDKMLYVVFKILKDKFKYSAQPNVCDDLI